MKIRRLRLKNFRKISSVPDPTIELNPDINVLVGANNTGKTSIIHAIQILLNSAPITPERDLNYLIKDGALILEGDMVFSEEQWISYQNIAVGDIPQFIEITPTDIENAASLFCNTEVTLKKLFNFLGRRQSNQMLSTFFTHRGSMMKYKGNHDIIYATLNQFGRSDFYNVSNTPLYLDSKGQLPGAEMFVPYNDLKGNTGKNNSNIRAQLYFLKKNEPEKFKEFKVTLLNIFTELEDLVTVQQYYKEIGLHNKAHSIA